LAVVVMMALMGYYRYSQDKSLTGYRYSLQNTHHNACIYTQRTSIYAVLACVHERSVAKRCSHHSTVAAVAPATAANADMHASSAHDLLLPRVRMNYHFCCAVLLTVLLLLGCVNTVHVGYTPPFTR
jgi:hypothetical protein